MHVTDCARADAPFRARRGPDEMKRMDMKLGRPLLSISILALAAAAALAPHGSEAGFGGNAIGPPARAATDPQFPVNGRLAAAKRKSSGQAIRSVPTTPESPIPKKKKASKQKKKTAKPLPG